MTTTATMDNELELMDLELPDTENDEPGRGVIEEPNPAQVAQTTKQMLDARNSVFVQWLKSKFDASVSVRDAAKEIGFAHVTLRSWLLGLNLPSTEAVQKLSAHFKVNEDWLLEITGHRTPKITLDGMDPIRQEFIEWLRTNINSLPLPAVRGLRKMIEELVNGNDAGEYN